VCIVLSFALGGCGKNVTSQPESDATETESFVKDELHDEYQKIEWISDIPLSEIKCIKDNGSMDIQSPMFITKSGELYEFTTNGIYSNEQVCKKIDTDIKYDEFYLYPNDRDLSLIISNEGEYYYLDNDKELQTYDYDYDGLIHKINNEHPNNYGRWEGGATDYDIFYYIEDNKIYQSKYESLLSGSHEFVSEDIIDTIPEGESFVSLEGKIIKTDKNYYILGITNQEECSKYVDTEPVLGLVKLEDVSSEYDKISYFNGNYIIYNDDMSNLYIYAERTEYL
jgi:hypothetical protein